MTLRHGFTTGTAAAAAAKAATLGLIRGRVPNVVDVPLPMGGRLQVAVGEKEALADECMAAVTKDGGDDPDATHGAVIRARTRWQQGEITIRGGPGVGMVTRPGLPVPVGQSAINPVPRVQITQAVTEALEQRPPESDRADMSGVDVVISVDRGEDIARKTFNPRLGIVGGISILGTRGTVKPFSHWAYQATIRQTLDVMRACGVTRPALTTGGRSEACLRRVIPDLSETACAQVADFFFFAMREAGQRGFPAVLWGVFFGKLVKQAQGHRYTHAKGADLDLTILATWCRQCGFSEADCRHVAAANTARQVLDDMRRHPALPHLLALLTDKARHHAGIFARSQDLAMQVDYLLFDFDGQVLHDTREHP